MNTIDFWPEKIRRQVKQATSHEQMIKIIEDLERGYTEGRIELPDYFWSEMTQMLSEKYYELSRCS